MGNNIINDNKNIVNKNNTYITVPPPTKISKLLSWVSNKKLFIALLISFISIFSISFTVYVGNNTTSATTTTIKDNDLTDLSEDYYTKTVVHGSAEENSDKKQVIKVQTSLYENVVINDISYDENGDCIKTATPTEMKVADIIHVYYPNSVEYEEVYEKYLTGN